MLADSRGPALRQANSVTMRPHMSGKESVNVFCMQNGHPDEEEEREKGVVVFSTDSRPVKRRKTNVDRQFERMSAKQVSSHQRSSWSFT